MLTVVYSTYYEQLILNIVGTGGDGRARTDGCVRHLVQEQHPGRGRAGSRAGGGRLLRCTGRSLQQGRHSREDSGGGGGECYTDVVVTRSAAAWLTSFLFESSPLAAFMSFRKFSTVFFMFFNSPGCGVARL